MMKSVVAIGTAPLIAVAALPSCSQAPPDARSVEVGFADLDLSGPSGRASLERRIQAAAADICGRPPLAGVWADTQRCQLRAVEGAHRRLAATLTSPALAQAQVQVGGRP